MRAVVLVVLAACAGGAPPGARGRVDSPSSPGPLAASPTPPAEPRPSVAPPRLAAPTEPLTIPEARRYMVALINRDRATAGLAPVELDEGAPTTAGQAHAEDMVRLGYLGHWGSDGSVPEQRHTDAGGADMVLENALCFTDERTRELDPQARIAPAEIERAESMFFDEVPPNDGHRRNILRASHTRVGVGIAQSRSTAKELAVPCFTQELVDGYGAYTPIPRKAKVGATIHVEANVKPGVRPTGVGVARVPKPLPLAARELNKRRSYPVPKPYQMYWGPGFVTPVQAKINGTNLAIDIPLDDKKQPGLYEVSVWAKLPGSEEQSMIGLRTIIVD